ncbi:hypothetical protein NCAS_0B03130 [Naumovozyma castellii]|uniref:Uncharacterized protein n=1 Tax=Naumovozyma castellii TaxID=27288 RepID=G0VBS1_NAUCA|nr:hypothetical protein NCAS_0B03130 [Naumovozyma castellii CBS 4309]CCC68397.1 hypothetical protein NCAS_0B03130 [Naumovozyma castellii CBS 4309]
MNENLQYLLEDPTRFHYKEYWLKSSTEGEREILELFSFGTISELDDLHFNKGIVWTPNLIEKLNKLTLISMSEESTKWTYDEIFQRCKINDINTIERYLIQLQAFFEVEINSVEQTISIVKYFDCRDVYGGELPLMILTDEKLRNTKDQLVKDLERWKTKLLTQILE